MMKYCLKRIYGMLVVMFVVTTLVFFMGRVAPGDPASVMLGIDATPEQVAELRERWGLNSSIAKQYFIYLSNVARGDLGDSLFLNRPVVTALMERAEPTLLLTVLSLLIATVIALPLGVIAAYRRGSALDQIVTTVGMLAASIPTFWLGLILIQVLAVKFDLLPVSGYGPPGAGFMERMSHLALPALAIGLTTSAIIMRFTRASMLDVLQDEYVRTARSKGMSEARMLVRHALKNALIPILTILGLTFAGVLGGAVVTETVFGVPGLGSLVISAVSRRDYPVLEGALLVVAATKVLINFSVDMLYLLVDPRVRYA